MYRRRLIYECEHWDAPASSPASFAPVSSSLSPPPPLPPSSVNRLLLSKSLSAVVTLLSAAFLLGVFYVTMTRWYQRRNSSRRAMHLHPPPPPSLDRFLEDPEQINYVWYINTVGLDESLINLITKCRYKKGEGLIEEKDCAVCLSEFQEGEDLRFLPKCIHAFHLECIDKWLRAHVNCPLCRAPVAANPSNFIPAENSDGASSTVGEPRVVDIESNGVQGGSALGAIGDADREREMQAIDSCVGESNREFLSADKRVEGSPSKFQPFRRSVSMDSPARIQVSMTFGANSAWEFQSLASRRMTTIVPESCEKSNPAELSSLRGVDPESGEEKSELQDLGDADEQSRPQDMKRSFSIGNNFFFPKHGHSRR